MTPAPKDSRSSSEDHLYVLLEQSVPAWGLLAKVVREADGAIGISTPGRRLRVWRAAPDAPFRWMVSIDDRRRPAVSIVAVLRQVRQALDPTYVGARVRIAPMAARLPRDT